MQHVMMTKFRVWGLGFATAVWSMGIAAVALPGAAAADATASEIEALAPIQLEMAQFESSSLEAPSFRGQFKLANLAFEKVVTVHYRWKHEGAWSEWLTVPAQWSRMIDSQNELWSFQTKGVPGYVRGADFQFLAEYTVAGQTYRDDNQGEYFKVGAGYIDSRNYPRVILGSRRVAPSGWSYTVRGGGNYTIEVMARKFADRGKVTIVYSFDQGKSWSHHDAGYQYSLTDAISTWSAVIPAPRKPMLMAIRYEVDGQTYWDNNYGENFQVNP